MNNELFLTKLSGIDLQENWISTKFFRVSKNFHNITKGLQWKECLDLGNQHNFDISIVENSSSKSRQAYNV